MILLLFIACIVVNTSSSHSSISTKVISFNSTKYDFFDIVVEKDNNMEIILADNYGRVTSINLKTGQKLSKKIPLNPIKQLKVFGDEGDILIRQSNTIFLLNKTLQKIGEWQSQFSIKSMTVTVNATGNYLLGIVTFKVVREMIVHKEPQHAVFLHTNVYDGFIMPADYGMFHPRHQYLYLVNQRKAGLVLFDLNFIYPYNTTIKQEEITVMRKGDIVLERNFNFKIKNLITDYKDKNHGNPDSLMLLSEDDTFYLTIKGTITSYLPYKNSTQDKLLGYDYCKSHYFLTLHSYKQKNSSTLYLLTLFNKKTWLKSKIILLNQYFDDVHSIIGIKCMENIVFVHTVKNLLILEHFYQENISVRAQQRQFRVQYWQGALTLLLLAFFMCFCRKSNRQPKIQEEYEFYEDLQQQEEKQSSSQRQDTVSSSKGKKVIQHSPPSKEPEKVSVQNSRKKKRKSK